MDQITNIKGFQSITLWTQSFCLYCFLLQLLATAHILHWSLDIMLTYPRVLFLIWVGENTFQLLHRATECMNMWPGYLEERLLKWYRVLRVGVGCRKSWLCWLLLAVPYNLIYVEKITLPKIKFVNVVVEEMFIFFFFIYLFIFFKFIYSFKNLQCFSS